MGGAAHPCMLGAAVILDAPGPNQALVGAPAVAYRAQGCDGANIDPCGVDRRRHVPDNTGGIDGRNPAESASAPTGVE